MDLGLQGKTAVITGGSKGIGLACAKVLMAEGCDVVLVARSPDALESARAELAGPGTAQVRTMPLDIADAGAREQLASVFDDASILINNAGAIPGGALQDVSFDQWKTSWELKVHGYIEMTRLVLQRRADKRGTVVLNVIGNAGVHPKYNYVCGATANSALITFTKAVGGQCTTESGTVPADFSWKARVLGINPGATRTDRLMKVYRARALGRYGDAERWRELLDDQPFGRLTEPEEIAWLAAFLVSAKASYLSGVVVDADGGVGYR